MLKSNLTLKSLLRSLAIVVVVLAVVLVIVKVKAGDSLDPPGPPTPGTMKTLGQLYCKLTNTDCPGDVPSLDPTAAPGTTMHTIKEVYDYAPEKSQMDAATADVACGKDFFGTGGTEIGTGCAICKECIDSSCSNMTDDTQDTTNDAGITGTCDQTCKKCSGGSCVNQTDGEDLFAQCAGSSCCGYCDGSGACDYVSYYVECTSPDDSCTDDYCCDGSGNCINCPKTTIYVTTASSDGDLGGRLGADNFCKNNKPSNLPADCSNIHAFLSVNGSDEIRDMPDLYGYDENLPIFWWHNENQEFNRLADNWADMLDGSIYVSQSDGTGDNHPAWSGSYSDGSWSYNCVQWTSDDGYNDKGRYSFATDIDGDWLYGSSFYCNITRTLRCMCVK